MHLLIQAGLKGRDPPNTVTKKGGKNTGNNNVCMGVYCTQLSEKRHQEYVVDIYRAQSHFIIIK